MRRRRWESGNVSYNVPTATRPSLLGRLLLVRAGVYVLPLGRFAGGKLGPFHLVVEDQRFLLSGRSALGGVALFRLVLRPGQLGFNRTRAFRHVAEGGLLKVHIRFAGRLLFAFLGEKLIGIVRDRIEERLLLGLAERVLGRRAALRRPTAALTASSHVKALLYLD